MSPAAATRISETVARIAGPDVAAARGCRALLDAKTKPRGSLGRLEQVARRVAAIRGTADVAPLRTAIVVAAADHGVAEEGVSAYPPEVTSQMVGNFIEGGAAINVLARRAGAEVIVVDAGIAKPIDDRSVRDFRIGAGTRNLCRDRAMSEAQALRAVGAGIEMAEELADDGFGIVGTGEMGIGNSTSAAAVTAGLLERDAREVCGRGTGLDDAGLARKVGVVRAAVRRHALRQDAPLDVLSAVGGFEIAFLTGLVLGAAAARLVVMLDGFIATSAALVAVSICPAAKGAMIASHRSPEPGHRLALEALELDPLLDLELRLGEGTGAALALPIVQASLAIVAEMATFDDAGVSDAGR